MRESTLIVESTERPTGELRTVLNGQTRTMPASPGEPEISIVIPTRNEVANVETLMQRLAHVLPPSAEVIFVDDSDDATAYRIRQLVEHDGIERPEIRLLHRPFARRVGGLGTAVTEGMRVARAPWVCVLDADLQHPPELIMRMMAQGEADGADVVVATRYSNGGSEEGLSASRRMMSRGCAQAAKALLHTRLSGTSDPLSGFFLVRRGAIDVERLRPNGFKILLEILGRHPELRVSEVGYSFSERYAGLSKASMREARRFARQLLSLSVPARATAPAALALRPALYDIHGIISVSSEFPLPELEKFRVQQLDGVAAIQVRKLRDEGGEFVGLSDAVPHMRYQETLGKAGFVVEVEIGEVTTAWVSPLVSHSRHVLYTNVVEPILRFALVERGFALVHAACFAQGDEAFLITARTDTGKTTTMLKILDQGDFSFLSDDLTLIDRSGQVLTYPKPLTISHHTVHALRSAELGGIERFFLPLQSRLHSRAGRRFAFLIASRRFPVASLNAAVQWLIPPPKYHVERLVPGVRADQTARIRQLFVIERSEREELVPVRSEEAIDIFVANCDDAYGFPPYESLETVLRFRSGVDLRESERQILVDALNGRDALVVRSATMGWASTIADLINGRRVIELRDSAPAA